jgi:pimeloyl-ACP methyl ester carboxylesterase
VVVSKSAIARLNHFELFVDAEFVSSYRADALIIATPTGSTAYSLGAGGPILHPDVDAFLITPVSPHGLTHRPVVVRDTVEIEIRVKTGKEEAYLSFDGQVGMPARVATSCAASRRSIRPGCCGFRKHFSRCSPPSSSGENADQSDSGLRDGAWPLRGEVSPHRQKTRSRIWMRLAAERGERNAVSKNVLNEIHPGLPSTHSTLASERSIELRRRPRQGPPLVLLHGLGRRWQVFLPIIPAFSLRWHIFAVDLRGHGKSSRVARGYHGPQYSEDIACFLRERVSTPAVLFGHSLGGMLAMWVASHHPELVRALILGDNIIVARTTFNNPMYTALFSGLRDLARTGGGVEQIADRIGKIVLPLPGSDAGEFTTIRELPGNDKAYLLSWARCVQQADPDTYDMTLDGSSLEGWDGETVLRGITCPTLLLASQPGVRRPDVRRGCGAGHALAATSHPCEVPNLGHALFIQQPEPVLRAVTNFLESL